MKRGIPILLMIAVLVACTMPPSPTEPATATPPSGATGSPAPTAAYSVVLYIQRPTEPPRVVSIDPTTLANLSDRPPFTLASVDPQHQPQFIVAPASGTVVALTETTVRVLAAATGGELARFPRRQGIFVEGVSPDGSRLLGTLVESPNTPEWALLSVQNGAVLVRGEGISPVYDWAHRRVYSLVYQYSARHFIQPRPSVLLAYDLDSGQEVGRLTLDEVLTGSIEIEYRTPYQIEESFVGPSMALSPAGQVVLLHGDADRLTVVDGLEMQVVATRDLQGSQDPLEPGTAVRNWHMQFTADGQLYAAGSEQRLVVEEGQSPLRSLGIRRIDVARATVEAEAFIDEGFRLGVIMPDGSAIYGWSTVYAPMPDPSAHMHDPAGVTVLQRLDPHTLTVTAEREFADTSYGFQLAVGSRSADVRPTIPPAQHDEEVEPVPPPRSESFVSPPPIPPAQADEIAEAARRHVDAIRTNRPEKRTDLGLTDQHEFANATVGMPAEVYYGLAPYIVDMYRDQPDQRLAEHITRADEWVIPVVVDGEGKSLITVAYHEEQWQVTSVDVDPLLARNVVTLQQQFADTDATIRILPMRIVETTFALVEQEGQESLFLLAPSRFVPSLDVLTPYAPAEVMPALGEAFAQGG